MRIKANEGRSLEEEQEGESLREAQGERCWSNFLLLISKSYWLKCLQMYVKVDQNVRIGIYFIQKFPRGVT